MMILLIYMLMWIPATLVQSHCQFFYLKFFCSGINQYDFKYNFYKNEESFYNAQGGTFVSSYEIEIVNSNYTEIEKIVAPPLPYFTITLTKLKITNCSVEYVKEDAFQKLDNLQHLDLSHNNIVNISFVENLPIDVDYLDLSNNRIKSVDFSIFKVPVVNLKHNFITTLIPAYADSTFEFVDLSNNRISKFDATALNCFFASLNLNYNELTTVFLKSNKDIKSNITEVRYNQLSLVTSKEPPYFVDTLDLTHSVFNSTIGLFVNKIIVADRLIIRNSVIPVLNNGTLNLTEIQRYINSSLEKPIIDFSNSSIRDIAEFYFEGVRSPFVNLSLNSLETIRLGVFQDASLDILDISKSKLKSIEKGAFYRLRSRAIYLHNNELNSAGNICESATVEKIDLSFNLIETIGNNSFSGCDRLQTLIMSNSLISKIHPHAFDDLNYLQLLDLKNNKLSILESSTVPNFHLYELELQENETETTQNETVNNLQNSQNISHNQIEYTEKGPFSDLYALKELDLTNNNLITIEEYMVSNLSLHAIKLEGNKIDTVGWKAFNNLNRLQLLNLSSCDITSIEGYAFSNMNSIKIIDLANNKLRRLESNTFLNMSVTTINFKGNHITHIESKAFNNLYKLRVLNISGMGINHIEGKAFYKLPVIEVIDLSDNNLTVLEKETFYDLPVRVLEFRGNNIKSIKSNAFTILYRLQKLNFSRYGITNLESKAFSYLPKVESIDIRYNNISALSDDMFYEMDNINSIYLEGNNLTSLRPFDDSLKLKELTITFNGILKPNAISNIYLKKLSIVNSEIKVLEKNCFLGLYSLNELHFNNSNIYSVEGDALNGLFHLTYLDSQPLFKSTNTITSGNFKDLKRLSSLDLSDLELKTIDPEAFSGLEDLRTLYLQYNKIEKMSSSVFKGLITLIELYLNNNNIDQIIPLSFKDQNKLRKLFLQHNSLSSLKAGTFSGLERLEELHLDHNRIESLPGYIFTVLTKLRSLYLNNNKISELQSHCFNNLGYLETLFLQSNELADIPRSTFVGVYYIRELRLGNNKLRSLDYNIIGDFNRLKTIDLSNNPGDFRTFRYQYYYKFSVIT